MSISKEKIRKTIICYWKEEDQVFIAESALLPYVVIGVGETKKEAIDLFHSLLDDVFEEFEADNVAGYSEGKPIRQVQVNVLVNSRTAAEIAKLVKALDISTDDAVDYLAFYYIVGATNKPTYLSRLCRKVRFWWGDLIWKLARR